MVISASAKKIATTKEITIFLSYAPVDQELCQTLESNLRILKRHYPVSFCFRGGILVGSVIEGTVKEYLEKADLILFLVSPEYLTSKDCDKEMQIALKRYAKGKAKIAPIHLRTTFLEDDPLFTHRQTFTHLQMLPTGGKALTAWTDQGENRAQGRPLLLGSDMLSHKSF